MDTRLVEYIAQNQVCTDLIFRDWDAFLDVLFGCGSHVEAILWFEYVRINQQKDSLGAGGFRDTLNPTYMWAETMMFDEELASKSLAEIRKHICEKAEAYLPHVLVPGFYIAE